MRATRRISTSRSGWLIAHLLVRLGEDARLARVDLALHALDDPVALAGLHSAFQRADERGSATEFHIERVAEPGDQLDVLPVPLYCLNLNGDLAVAAVQQFCHPQQPIEAYQGLQPLTFW